MRNDYWSFVDTVLTHLKKRYVKAFRGLNGLVPMDELHRLEGVKALYSELDHVTQQWLYIIADEYYRKVRDGGVRKEWLWYYLEYFAPVTKYQYDKEVERKTARCYESLMASKVWRPEIKTALKLWTLQATHYCEEIAKQATLQALRDKGVKYVMWETADDEKVCETCGGLDGKVFPIDKVPPTPHYNCRCIWKETDLKP